MWYRIDGCRAVNNALLDTYQLKSLDAVVEATTDDMRLVKKGDRIKMELVDQEAGETENIYDNFAMRELYDKVILCLGFQFDNGIFNR